MGKTKNAGFISGVLFLSKIFIFDSDFLQVFSNIFHEQTFGVLNLGALHDLNDS